MKFRRNTQLLRLLALVLALALVLPTGIITASAEAPESHSSLPVTVQPRASDYLGGYGVNIRAMGDGVIYIEYSVDGTDRMDVLGYMSIALYESTDCIDWTRVKTFHWTNYTDMLGYDSYSHSGWLEYQGVEGRYYMTLACVYAGKGSGYDTIEFYSNHAMAT